MGHRFTLASECLRSVDRELKELRQGMNAFVRQKAKEIGEERQYLSERMRDLVEIVRNQGGESQQNHMAACRFSEAELEKFVARRRNSAEHTAHM